MSYVIESLSLLTEQLAKLPGIGGKTAQRLAYHILTMPKAKAKELAASILTATEHARFCSVCGNLTDQDPCSICTDVMAMERGRVFRGKYHVLGGALSPMDGIGPDQLRIKELLARLEGVDEVVIATNPDVEGEATAVYLWRLLSPMGIRVSRIAHGVPVGGDLEYTDDVTLQKAMEGRRIME